MQQQSTTKLQTLGWNIQNVAFTQEWQIRTKTIQVENKRGIYANSYQLKFCRESVLLSSLHCQPHLVVQHPLITPKSVKSWFVPVVSSAQTHTKLEINPAWWIHQSIRQDWWMDVFRLCTRFLYFSLYLSPYIITTRTFFYYSSYIITDIWIITDIILPITEYDSDISNC